MLSWAIAFLVLAVLAAILGFGGIATTAAGMAKNPVRCFPDPVRATAAMNALKGRPPPA